VADWPGASVTFKVEESYRNMKEVLDRFPQVVENAREAIRRAGIELREAPIRGGTDGARLCFMGLPRVGLGPGHGEGGGGHRPPVPHLGRAGLSGPGAPG
jgi:tripeptide aminopeptidase